MRGVAPCQTPSKRAFRSQAAAQVRADEVSLLGGDVLEAYECPCGEWHLRNPVKYAGKNAFHAKQRARRVRLEAARAHERAALGLDVYDRPEVTECAPKEVTDEYGSPDPPGGD